MAPGYAVTAVQWLLTALFAVIYDVRRAFHLDDVRDIGFVLITGRARTLSHSTFQHLLHAIPAEAAWRFYQATARWMVRGLGAGVRRISLDGLQSASLHQGGRCDQGQDRQHRSGAQGGRDGAGLRFGRLALVGSTRLPGCQEVEPGTPWRWWPNCASIEEASKGCGASSSTKAATKARTSRPSPLCPTFTSTPRRYATGATWSSGSNWKKAILTPKRSSSTSTPNCQPTNVPSTAWLT